MPIPPQAEFQPLLSHMGWDGACATCNHLYRGIYTIDSRCHVKPSDVRPLGCPTFHTSREAHWDSVHARRIAIGKSPYSTTARHRELNEAVNYENDEQTICYDCEATHQLSCLCFGHNGVPADCVTYNARRTVIDATSRYDIREHGLSHVLTETERWVIEESE